MKRIRVTATLDADGVSPDAIRAAQEYLTSQMEARATVHRVALDWNSWRTYVRHHRNGDRTLIQFARVLP